MEVVAAVFKNYSTTMQQDCNRKMTTSKFPFGQESQTGMPSEKQTASSPEAHASVYAAPEYATISLLTDSQANLDKVLQVCPVKTFLPDSYRVSISNF